jgi:DnaJ-class molecular chaperone
VLAAGQEKALSSNPYDILGVKKDVSQEDIQKAYRSLAKKLHPDLNPGNKTAEEEFKKLSGANDLLGDAAKRKRFDNGEIDEQGTERPKQRFYRDYADSADNQYASGAGFSDFDGAEDIFSGIFGRQRGAGRANLKMRGSDVRYHMPIDFLDAVNGGKKLISLPEGSTLDVTIPAGVRDGMVLRLRGKGRPGLGGGPPGDAQVEIEVRPHSVFTRKGDDIHVELPISLADAVLGGNISVPTPFGPVNMIVPKWTNTGKVLRLKGKGVTSKDRGAGDEYVILKVMLPEKPDSDLEKFVSQWRLAETAIPNANAET